MKIELIGAAVAAVVCFAMSFGTDWLFGDAFNTKKAVTLSLVGAAFFLLLGI